MIDRAQLKDQIYLQQAVNISGLSKDENTKVGAIIIASDGTPVSWGYNGTIPGFPDEEVPHSREEKELCYIENDVEHKFSANKYPFMEHAEANAIDFGDRMKMKGATIFVTHLPCKDCARKIAKHGIKKVVVPELEQTLNSSIGSDSDITKYIFALANIELSIGGKSLILKSKEA